MTDNMIGAHRVDDPRGWLIFESLPNELQRLEDQRQAADHARLRNGVTGFTRPATPTERTLLEHLGYEVPEVLHTQVLWLSAGVRSRTWPALTAQAA